MSTENKTDYSRRDRWYSFPEITKDVDAIYIYGTMYVRSSVDEGAPDYAAIDNPEMLERIPGDYEAHASVFGDSANVFAPFYRQAGLRFAAGEYTMTNMEQYKRIETECRMAAIRNCRLREIKA